MHEARATRRWIRDEAQAAIPALKFWPAQKPRSANAPSGFGRYLANRLRDVMLTPVTRAWDESTYIIEVVIPEDALGVPSEAGDPFAFADQCADALDQRFNPKGRPRTNVSAPFGCLIVSCQRTAQIDYTEYREGEANRIHRGGMFKIRTEGPKEEP